MGRLSKSVNCLVARSVLLRQSMSSTCRIDSDRCPMIWLIKIEHRFVRSQFRVQVILHVIDARRNRYRWSSEVP